MNQEPKVTHEAIDVTIGNIIESINCSSYRNDMAVIDVKGPFRSTRMPIRIDAVFVYLCIKGSAHLTISLQDYEMGHNTLCTLLPKDFLSRFDATDDFEGRILVFSTQVLELLLPKLTELLPVMMNHPLTSVINLKDEETAELLEFFTILQKKIGREETPFKDKKLLCLLQSVMFEMIELNHKGLGGTALKKSRKEEIMANFIISVSENFRKHREVGFYADELCITPKHLSSVVKQISGRTAGEWIGQYVIMEAKVLLRTTDMTIQEITTTLNFANQSFFGKYFKHITGMSPTTYRKGDS